MTPESNEQTNVNKPLDETIAKAVGIDTSENSTTSEEEIKVPEDKLEEFLQSLYTKRDKNHEHKFLIVNEIFNNSLKPYLVSENGQQYRVILDQVAGFKYIVSPFWKDKKTPQAITTKIDLNKVASVNSVYEDEVVTLEDILFLSDTFKW